MDDIIQKLVEFDRECVERVNAAKQKKSDAQMNVTEKKSAIYQEYIESQQATITQHKHDLLEKNEAKAKEQEEEFLASMKNLDTLYQEKKELWIDEIYKKCIK